MHRARPGSWRVLFLIGGMVLAGCGATAEEPKASAAAAPADQPAPSTPSPTLPGVDLSPLTEAQKAEAMRVFRENRCNCGCGMTIVDCRTKDPNCGRSPVLAAQVVQAMAAGKSADEAAKIVFAAAPAPAAPAAAPTPAGAPPIMVFDVPIGDSYALGPEDAPVTIVTWLDYQ